MRKGISGLLVLLLIVGLAIAVVAVGLGIVGGIVSFGPSGAVLGFEGFVYRYDGGSLIVHGAVHNLGSETVRIVAVNATYSARVNGSCVSTTVRMSFVPSPLVLAPNEVRELVASAKNVPAPCTNVVTLVVRYCSPGGCYESVATAGLGSYLELIQYVTRTVSVPITTTVYSFITRTVTIPGGGGGTVTVTRTVPVTITETITTTTTRIRYIVTTTTVGRTLTTRPPIPSPPIIEFPFGDIIKTKYECTRFGFVKYLTIEFWIENYDKKANYTLIIQDPFRNKVISKDFEERGTALYAKVSLDMWFYLKAEIIKCVEGISPPGTCVCHDIYVLEVMEAG